MLLHRRKANVKRKQLDRGLFAWGPTVNDPDATEYRFTCLDSLEEHATDDECDVFLPSKRKRIPGEASHVRSRVDVGTSQNDPETPEIDSDCAPVEAEVLMNRRETLNICGGGETAENDLGGDYVPHVPIANISESLPTIFDDHQSYDSDRNMVLQLNPNLPLVPENMPTTPLETQGDETSRSESTLSSGDGSEHLDFEELESDYAGQVSFFNIEMQEWLRRDQKWVQILYEYGIEYSVMDKILRNIAAPCKSSKTVVTHLMRNAGISTSLETYNTCPGHFCFSKLPGHELPTCCPICGRSLEELVSRKENGIVQYIPLMPRIAAAVKNAATCQRLYDYCHLREASNDLLPDYFDGTAYEDLLSAFGGEQNVKNDIFLAISTDGFQAFRNKRVDIWPLLGVLFNLPPSERYKVHNVLPFLFTTDVVQPKDLQSFLIPLISEMDTLYREDGKLLEFYDGSMRRVRVHLVCVTADLAALVKLASLSGYNGKTPCRYCMIQGVYFSSARHYYFPSALLLNETSNRRTMFYNPRALRSRSVVETVETFDELRDANSHAERQRIAKETGITGRSVLFELATITPFRSFPPDIMHLLYNVQKHLLEIQTSSLNEPFTFTKENLDSLDQDILCFHKGISGQLAPKPRKLSEFYNWKSAEHKQFSLSYCLILFDGYMPQDYLNGMAYFVEIVDICFRRTVSQEDVARLRTVCISFFEHFEARYVRYSKSRSHLCKYTLHLLLHLADGLQDYGPLMSVSQYWVEKYIGWIVGRNKARNLVAESMTKRVLTSESYKIFYDLQFDTDLEATDVLPTGEEFVTLGPHRKVSLASDQGSTTQFKILLINYLLRKFDSIASADARVITSRLLTSVSSSKIAFRSGHDVIVAKVFDEKALSRPSCYIAVEMEGEDELIDVYYGTLMKILSIELSEDVLDGYMNLLDFAGTYTLIQCSWASDMLKGKQGQIFKNCSRSRAFSRQTLEDASILTRLIGVVEHAVLITPTRKRMRTYFVDNFVREHRLLDASKVCFDGSNRNLKGMARRG